MERRSEIPAEFQYDGKHCQYPGHFCKSFRRKDGKVSEYWSSIRELITEDTMVIKSFPYIQPLAANPIKPYVTEFYKNGRLQKAKIKTIRRMPMAF